MKEQRDEAREEFFDAMAEIRMKAEYGDYLAYTCAAHASRTQHCCCDALLPQADPPRLPQGLDSRDLPNEKGSQEGEFD